MGMDVHHPIQLLFTGINLHEHDERRYSIDCGQGKPLTSETG
jgi:hypothetical protein